MEFIKALIYYTGIFFVIYMIGYSTFLFVSVVTGAITLFENRKKEKLKNELIHDYYFPISIIIPAYNEEITVVDTINSLLSIDYKLYEIIVVDDGSNDNTVRSLLERFNMNLIHRPINIAIECKPAKAVYECYDEKVLITIIQKENGGKADALNMGINASQYPYFICMDADSVLQYDSLEKIISSILEDNNIIASGGLVRPSNGLILNKGRVVEFKISKNILAAMQTLEYERSFLASRMLFDKFNGNLIVSGAFGLFKKDIVITVGGYDQDTMGEDMELILKLHMFCRSRKYPYRIRYAPDAVCWTQVPETLVDLIKQRRRWHIGLLQSMWGYKEIFANPKYGMVGSVSYLYYLIYELLSPFIEVFGIITIIIASIVKLINVRFMIVFFLIYVLFGVVLTITASFTRIHTQNLKFTFKDFIKSIVLCVFEITILRFILAIVRLTSVIQYRKNRLKWGVIQRSDNKVNK